MPDVLTDRKTGKQFILSADVPTGTVTPPTPRYTVTITGGYLDDDPAKTTASYEEGSTVTITATSPPSGKKFSHFTVEGGNNIDASPAIITVTRNLVITTVFVDLPDDSYLSGTWSPSSGTEGSSYTTFDSGKNTTPIGKIGNKDVYGMYFANDALGAWAWSDYTGSVAVWKIVDTDEAMWYDTDELTFTSDANTFDKTGSILAAVKHFYTKINN